MIDNELMIAMVALVQGLLSADGWLHLTKEHFYKLFTQLETLTAEKVIAIMTYTKARGGVSFDTLYRKPTASRCVPIAVGDRVYWVGKPCSRGNKKIVKSELVQKILPYVTCAVCASCWADAEGKVRCYAGKAIFAFPNTFIFELLYTYKAQQDPAGYVDLIIEQAKNSRSCKSIRIHEAGDFFSAEYAAELSRIHEELPDLPVHTYTKTDLQPAGVHVVKSEVVYNNEKIANFGAPDFIEKVAADLHLPICPCKHGFTDKQGRKFCGGSCKLCQGAETVLFYET